MPSLTRPARAGHVADSNITAVTALPDWLPADVRLYLDHTEDGTSLRELARRDGLHASTVLRQVRRCEMRRDDPLVDEALANLQQSQTQVDPMQHSAPIKSLPDDHLIHQEALRVLRRLAEAGAFLAIAPDLDKAAVMRALPDGRVMRMAVVDRAVAQAFALKDWISCVKPGRVASYQITAQGRAAVKARLTPRALQDAALPFQEADEGKRLRYNLAESPVAVLGRRRDKDGKPFLDPDLLRAAERLREDFELAQMGPKLAQNWDQFLTGRARGAGIGDGTGRDARARVAAALTDLGPGLGDVALRVCCYLEGVEMTEQRLGWAARSGKVVLRIALQRLWRHYEESYGRSGPLIG